MIQAIGDLLPSALGVALSPVPIIAVILMLGTPKARSTGSMFAIGWIAGLVIASAIVLALTSGASDPDSATSTGVNWFQVVMGVLFLLLALMQWRSRPQPGEVAELPKWMATIDTFTPGMSLGLGAIISTICRTWSRDNATAGAWRSAFNHLVSVGTGTPRYCFPVIAFGKL